ncbi:MAG: hypothetical protein K6G72_06975 [Lachnospiraceae bacterium]|nr:hypothetical protein [Lachnospiraceae bacterium]
MPFSWKNVKRITEFLLVFLMTYNIINVHERAYQTGKDYCSFAAIMALIVLLLVVSGTDFKKWYTIVLFLACIAGAITYIVVKDIGPDTYGVDYHKVVILKVFLFAVSVFSFVNAFCGRKKVEYLKSIIRVPFFWLSIFTFVLVAFVDREWVPFLCPFILVMLSKIDKDEWMVLADSFAASYFLVFVLKFTHSLIVDPQGYDITGRYRGLFLNVSKVAAFSGVALVCVVYFFIRLVRAGKTVRFRIFCYILIALMFAYSAVAFMMVRGRSGELGLLISFMAAFAFLHGKEKTSATLARLAILFGFLAVLIIATVIMANVLQSKIQSGQLKYEDLSYSMAHIAALAGKGKSRGLFEAGTLANALDELSAQRLTTWKDLGRQIIPFGTIENADYATHSTYLWWLVKYGLYPGTLIIIWFIIYIFLAAVQAVRKSPYVIFPLLWATFYAGAFLPSNEYWKDPGGLMLLVFVYPLIAFWQRKSVYEIKNR